VDATNDATLDVGAGLMLSCRITPNHAPTFTGVLLKDTSSPAGPYGLGQDSTDELRWAIYSSGSYKFVVGNIAALLGTTFRANAVYDGANISLYFGNTLEGTVAAPGTISNNTNPVTMGYHQFFNSYYSGKMDECIIFNKAPGASELTNIVNADQ
jgi:hypothetical protein